MVLITFDRSDGFDQIRYGISNFTCHCTWILGAYKNELPKSVNNLGGGGQSVCSIARELIVTDLPERERLHVFNLNQQQIFMIITTWFEPVTFTSMCSLGHLSDVNKLFILKAVNYVMHFLLKRLTLDMCFSSPQRWFLIQNMDALLQRYKRHYMYEYSTWLKRNGEQIDTIYK